MEVLDAKTKELLARTPDGTYVVTDQHDYVVTAEERLPEIEGVLSVMPIEDGRIGRLSFDNYVGLAEIAGQRFDVRNSKLSHEAFERMLDGVISESSDLAFDFGSPTELPFEREDVGASDEVGYHAVAYLRHVMRRVGGGERLLGQFLQIAANPSRRMGRELMWRETSRADTVETPGILAVASHPEHLVPIERSSRLATTGLGRALTGESSRALFPSSVLSSVRRESYDTHENRLVLHLLTLASDLVGQFEERRLINPTLREDLRSMREELAWMRSFDFLSEVGKMRVVPLQSTVLQRRDGYREFLSHYLRLAMSSTLADERDRWHALLDLKDSALLYELWAFFEVKRVVDGLLGAPARAQLVSTSSERRSVPWAVKVSYPNVDLAYNLTYRRPASYSLVLRPDVVIRSRRGDRRDALILDAKLKFDGERLDGLKDREPSEWDRGVNREDIYKMHTYRDAIREAVGAFVLYPGSKESTFPDVEGAPAWSGVGAVPLVPGEEPKALQDLLLAYLHGVDDENSAH